MHPFKYLLASVKVIKKEGLFFFLDQFCYDIIKKICPNFLSDTLYSRWIRRNESAYPHPERQVQEASHFTIQPKITIITPVWNVEEVWLRRMLDSVHNQTYGNWEHCIAEGGSENPDIRKILGDFSGRDSRIKVMYLKENQGISTNSNLALEMATGDYIVLLDHDDELAPNALCEIVKKLNQCPHLDFIYSDKDKIDEFGKRILPFFKPDWSPDLFLSINYVCHLTAIRKKIIDEIGGFRDEYDGAQDYDLFLRIFEKIEPEHIGHIPKVLYHWRVHANSTADSLLAKPYAAEAGKKAILAALNRRAIEGEVHDGLFFGSYRVKYTIAGNPHISIIIPSRDEVLTLKKCIDSIRMKTRYEHYQIVIIDNCSIEPETHLYYQVLIKDPKIKIFYYEKPFNFSAICNYGNSIVESEILVFLNNDTEVISGEWLTAMLEHAQRKNVGAVGAKLIYPDRTIQHAGVIIGIKGHAGHSHKGYPADERGYFGRIQLISNFSAVTGACMMLRKDVFCEVGGFDENLTISLSDIDLCLKMRAKLYVIVYTPYSEFIHHESLTRGYESTSEKKNRFLKELNYFRSKWKDILEDGDPYYNPNLTLEMEDFSIKIK